MRIKEFEKKYEISFDGCFVYDGLFKVSRKLNDIPEQDKEEFINDFMNLKI